MANRIMVAADTAGVAVERLQKAHFDDLLPLADGSPALYVERKDCLIVVDANGTAIALKPFSAENDLTWYAFRRFEKAEDARDWLTFIANQPVVIDRYWLLGAGFEQK